MNDQEGAPYKRRQKDRKWRRLSWSVKGPVFVLALLLGFFDHALHWGRAPFAAGLAISYPIFAYRDFWDQSRFWITIGLLAVVQVPLVIIVQPLMEALKFPFMLTFGLLDCALMVAAVSWVCSGRDGKRA
jgi:hypothetical protein